VIPRVRARGLDVREALRYLFGPGDEGEHRDQRLVAAWAMAAIGGLDELQPRRLPGGGFSVARLSALLEQPVVAAIYPPRRPVWHCSVHNHRSDPVLADGQWAQIAAEFVDAVGLAPAGDLDAARWVAVRHADDHIHIVAALVRQDGRTVWARQDYRRCQALSRRLEDRLGLHRVGRAATAAEGASA
jgi:hypothetical protein